MLQETYNLLLVLRKITIYSGLNMYINKAKTAYLKAS